MSKIEDVQDYNNNTNVALTEKDYIHLRKLFIDEVENRWGGFPATLFYKDKKGEMRLKSDWEGWAKDTAKYDIYAYIIMRRPGALERIYRKIAGV